MGKTLHRIYLRFRHPKVFLIALCAFIVTMLVLHFFFGVDSDWGGTNLTLSCEASVASAVITVAAEETLRLLKAIFEIVTKLLAMAEKQDRILSMLLALSEAQDKTLKGVLLIAEAQRDMLLDHRALLQALKEGDERILKTLTEGEQA
jgi:hypothetical protein